MDENTITIFKKLIAQVNAIELTLRDSDLADKYEANLALWIKEMDSRIGEAYLKSLSDDSADGEVHPEQ